MQFVEVILPLPLYVTFTYAVPAEMTGSLRQGSRVIVPFGRKKYYTGIVSHEVLKAPEGLEIKEIYSVLDDGPVVRRPQLQLWEWIAEYYLCSVGDVMKAALPAGLKVESETFIEAAPDWEEPLDRRLTEREAIVMQTLLHADKRMTVAEVESTTGLRNVATTAMRLMERGAAMVSERLIERYRSRKVSYVRIRADRNNPESLHALFDAVKSAKKQEKALMALLDMSGFTRRGSDLKEVTMTDLLEKTALTRPIIKAMADKGLVEIYKKDINRFRYEGRPTGTPPQLSEAQSRALDEIHRSWTDDRWITLLHGVTSSGKTEIYMHLIDYVLHSGRQTLYLVPEIALTTQLTRRLQQVFGDSVVIYHSKFTDNERVDIWRRMLSDTRPCVVIGARSSLFLPFADLGLVIVDEEHESSYKQENPAPRYNARDTAMVLARMHGAKVLLGSATPSVETYSKALEGRYGLVTLTERYGQASLPDIEIIDSLNARRKGQMKGILSLRVADLVRQSTGAGQQAILFLNRRGYAPVAECKMCAYTPKCEHCDVTLTYHRYIDKMVCHYCGAAYAVPRVCPSCREPAVEIFGYGTERIEDEVTGAFPDVKISRMDLDTTRSKEGYENIIDEFSSGRSRILVGTQMVTKGLDFDGVSTVAVLNADTMLNMPDFRASERAFNMLAQVAGRAGRRQVKGIVAMQTRQPGNPIFDFIKRHDYRAFYDYEIEERRRYLYPPFTRLIYVWLRHRDRRDLDEIAVAYVSRLRQLFGNRVFGPEEPAVNRVQSLYLRKVMLKIEVNASMKKVKQILRETYEELRNSRLPAARGVIVSYDVDPY